MPDLAVHYTGGEELSAAGYLLEVLAARPAWHADAACREHPEVSWFPERGQPAGPAKAVCGGCLVKAECRAWAAGQGCDLEGIWAGTSGRERMALRARPGA